MRRVWLVWIGLAAAVGIGSASGATLVSTGATWRYFKGTAEASTPISAWRQAGFADGSWAVGAAPFHYGYPEVTGGTLLPDMRRAGNNPGYASVFLRHAFTVSNPGAVGALRLRAVCDDGFIAWINGVEVARYNMPAGERAYNTFASGAVPEPLSWLEFDLPAPAYLVAGQNVLAVQVFNTSITSSDLQWDGELLSLEPDVEPPRVASVEPAPGTVEQLTQVTVTFTEPVVGVRAADVFLGAESATSVSGSGSVYVFTFAPPAAGPIELRWDAEARITDLATPANTFDPLTAGPWRYEIVDRTPPVVAELTPRPGLTVRRLTQAEVRFSEPVEGVEAADLLVNGVAARAVSGELAGPYRFEFTEPPPGQVQFTWAADHGIRDLANPPNAFTPQAWSVVVDPNYTVPPLRINEFLASNLSAAGLKDEDGELQDWIEIYNSSAEAVNLEGWSLTDDRDDPGRWVFPAVTLGPGQYLVVFASGKDRRATGAGARLHTNFKLGPEGEYLALLDHESPRVAVSEFAPAYPEQRNDYSYGYDAAERLRYFRTPTPGAPNGSSTIEGVVPPPHVNVGRGRFDAPFTLIVSSPMPGVTLRYTTDGSEPTASTGQLYTGPLHIERTTIFRVVGFAENFLPSRTVTHSYLFLNDVPTQPNNPPGYPSTWGTSSQFPGGVIPADYEMDLDPLRVDPNNPASPVDPEKMQRLKEGLLELPVVSLVLNRDDMFGPGGLYPRSSSGNKSPNEKACSVEMLLPDGTTAFVINGGLDLHGNASRDPHKNPKHGFKLSFRRDYGESRLRYRLFEDSAVEEFDDLILRPDFNTSWRHWSDVANNGTGAFQRTRATRTRDAWVKQTMRDMGQLASHSRFFHLFINGLYWGTFEFSEQPTAFFASTHFGGTEADYDIYDQGTLRSGTSAAYNAMLGLSNLANNANYEAMKERLNLPAFIDYMLLHFLMGHQDWGNNKNWYALRKRVAGPEGGFRYLPWDGEVVLLNENINRVSNSDVPSGLHTKLVDNAQYRLDFADRVHKHLIAPGGALTREANVARWQRFQALMDKPIVAESCRWGDYRRDVHPYSEGTYQLYTREQHWLPENDRVLNSYFVNRPGIVLGQLRSAGLYPSVEAPEFRQNSLSGPVIAGGAVPASYVVALRNPGGGTIYYTTDGSDPRVYYTGAVADSAQRYTAPLTLNATTTLKARVLSGGTWSALNEATFTVNEVAVPLRFTEIMYHPPGGDAHEFVELQYLGRVPLDVSGFSVGGIDFVFAPGTVLSPGQVIVLASGLSPTSFAARYPGVTVTGYFGGALANGGERLAVHDRDGRTLTAVSYDDDVPWPPSADGQGYSLEVLDPNGDPNDPANWRASATLDGSPGVLATPPALGAARLNELLARPATDAPGGEDADWIELANIGDSPVSLAGWTLTDHGTNAFVFPADAAIPAHGYLRVWCDGAAAGAGLHAAFRLDGDGETIGLYDGSGRPVDLVSFGPQVPGLSLGRLGAEGAWQLTRPTPEAANLAAELAAPSALKLNEWLANPRPGDEDWLELYNTDLSRPAALRGLVLATDRARFQMQSLTFLPPGGFLRLWADEGAGPTHLGFRLPAGGGAIALLDATGAELDRVAYAAQVEGASEGRLPDGAATIRAFAAGGSPGQSNAAGSAPGVILNELLADDGRGGGWVELFNPEGVAIALAGYSLAVQPGGGAWAFPAGTQLAASAHLVVSFRAARSAAPAGGGALSSNLALDGRGGRVSLRDPAGVVLDTVAFGFQIAGQSIGRAGGEWRLLMEPTPGAPNAAPATLGLASKLRFNEWLAAEAGGEDWFELFNLDTRPVSLSGLFLSDDPALGAQRKFQVGPLSFIAPQGWVAFAAGGSPGEGPDHVNFSLDQLGEALRLYDADGALIDAIDFGPQSPGVSAGRLTDGGNEIGVLTVGPTRGASNTPAPGDLDRDGDGLPDEWEIAHGTDPTVPDADRDPDGDGLTNAEEFLAGTHPNDAASNLSMAVTTLGPTSITLEFVARAGRSYTVLFKQSIEDAAWTRLTDVPAAPEDHVETVVDPAPAVGARFYRLVMPAQP